MDWAPDGDISKYEAIDIAEGIHFSGDPDVLLSALIESGYVAKTLEGREIVNWQNIGGQVIEGRKKAAAKKAEQREKAKAKKTAELLASRAVPGDIPGTEQGRPPNVPVYKELDLEVELYKEKDLKINGHADQNQKLDQNQEQNPKPEHTADKSAAPDESGKDGKKGPKGRQKPVYEPDSPYMKMAIYFKGKLDELAKVLEIDDLAPKANLQTWADDFRKLVELDKQSDKRLIVDVMDWLPKHDFWRKNVLSASTFRDKWTTLVVEMRSGKTATSNKGSGGRSGKQTIEIAHDDGIEGTPTPEQFAAMMAEAQAYQDRKRQEEAGRQGMRQ
ncbi:hypothetical protein [Paenibacillus monticola]|uniref:Uncharacterized protein n=1 Tax=Paenibacillus monticola TaxID=2666075 RepID=A0A7X2H1R4_9BACL|nr:hypothetical protein [Paenibacillus monticola]MRN51962.1 hypothetical protein [Paenibacillus monticola]